MVHWQKGKELKNGKFVIEEILGSGGFGITYKIVNPRTQEQFVIKTLNAIARSKKNFPELQDDFFNEAIKLAAFNHPNVVKVYPRGFSEDGLWCMLMEYIQGQNLEEYLQKNKQISENAAIALITKVGEALTYIHQRNYIHRDIKPSNIMLCNSNLSSPVLIDFGLAREFDPKKSMSMDNRLTEHFAPLEQYNLESYAKYINLERNQYRVGTWTDVYALAATLYVLLTRDIPMSAPMRKLSPKDFKPPKQLNPQISESVNGAILKGMAIEPQNRSQTVQQWLNLLKKVSFKDRDRVKSSTKSQSSYKAKSNFQSSQKNSQAEATAKTRQAAKKNKSSSQVNSPKKPFKPKGKIKLNGKIIGILVSSYFAFSAIYLNWNTMVAPVILGINLEKAINTEETIRLVRFSPNAKTLLTNIGYVNNIFKLWDIASGKEIFSFVNNNLNSYNEFRNIAFSPNGETLASGRSDNTIKLWDVATGKEISTLVGHSHDVSSVAFSPNGQTLVSGSNDNTIKLWDVATGKEISTLVGHSDRVNSVAFSPNGQTIASASNDKTIKLWNLSTGKEILTLVGHLGGVNSVAFSPNGETLVSVTGGVNDKEIKLWDLETKKEITTFKGDKFNSELVVFSPDSKILTSVSSEDDNDVIKLWDVATGEEIFTLKPSNYVNSLAFSPDGKTLVTGHNSIWEKQTLKLWDVSRGKEIASLKGDLSASTEVNSVAFSSDGKTFASGGVDDTIKIWKMPSR